MFCYIVQHKDAMRLLIIHKTVHLSLYLISWIFVEQKNASQSTFTLLWVQRKVKCKMSIKDVLKGKTN
jgi:hypothetical protein